MKYISIDLETTGLEADKHQILEFGAIATFSGDNRGYHELPKFHRYVKHNPIIGSPVALRMNAGIIEHMTDNPQTCSDVWDVIPDFLTWLRDIGFTKEDRVTPAGKNFDTLDRPFIMKLPDANLVNWNYKTLDPGILYLEINDKDVPSLTRCKVRANIFTPVTHDALSDAWDVIQVLRYRGL